MDPTERFESVLRHDRAIVAGALAGITLLAWVYMIHEARGMEASGVCECAGMAMSGPDVEPWSPMAVLPLSLMWLEMMVAMMIPSAAPMILTFARVNRQRRMQERPFVPTSLFVLGYLVIWGVFSVLAAVAQWGLHGAALLSPMMTTTSPVLGGGLLVFAGVFQWTPWKHTCLRHCRSPLQFLLVDWRDGARGALVMGIRHGAFCAGCCWLLMALLFVAGVMNMLWVAVITLLVLIEKAVPYGLRLAGVAGLLLAAWGVWMIAGAW